MGIEWAMIDEPIDDEEAIVSALKNGFEPFAVEAKLVPRKVKGGKTMHHISHIYFRKQFFNEDSEAKSSTRPENENWSGKYPIEDGDGDGA